MDIIVLLPILVENIQYSAIKNDVICRIFIDGLYSFVELFYFLFSSDYSKEVSTEDNFFLHVLR